MDLSSKPIIVSHPQETLETKGVETRILRIESSREVIFDGN